ncbi:MAG: FecR domain-containing protein [Flavobacteriales bacterium]|nr:FecR domain-containing protein [Flavobacteriales bacterium]
MDQEQTHIDDLLVRVLTGEASTEERARVDHMIATDASVRLQYVQWKKILSHASPGNLVFDTDRAWERVELKLQGFRKTTRVVRFTAWRIAASVAALAGISLLVYFFTQSQEVSMTLSANNTVVTDTLPDGSSISLNRGSTLAFHAEKGKRVARLTGEARFEVTHNEKEKFVVEVLDVFVEDLGTVFNVRTSENADTVEVNVSEGEVRLYGKDMEGIALVAGEMARYVKSENRISKIGQADENAASYADLIFRFRDTPLKHVIKKLNEVYDTHIELVGHNLDQCRITVTFEEETIETIADVIAQTLDLEVQHVGKTIRLAGAGCE